MNWDPKGISFSLVGSVSEAGGKLADKVVAKLNETQETVKQGIAGIAQLGNMSPQALSDALKAGKGAGASLA